MEYDRLQHELHAGALEYLAGECFDVHWEQALETQRRLKKALVPWLKEDEQRKALYRRMADQWAATWGDPNDEETKRRIDETVRGLLRKMVPSRPGRRRG